MLNLNYFATIGINELLYPFEVTQKSGKSAFTNLEVSRSIPIQSHLQNLPAFLIIHKFFKSYFLMRISKGFLNQISKVISERTKLCIYSKKI